MREVVSSGEDNDATVVPKEDTSGGQCSTESLSYVTRNESVVWRQTHGGFRREVQG